MCYYSYLDILALTEDRERNALLPKVGEHCLQSSSTDTRSVYDAENDSYRYWDGNNDNSFPATVTDESGTAGVALDVKGAGYIAGIWFAGLFEGKADLIIDGINYVNCGNRAKDLFGACGRFEGLDGLIYSTPGEACLFYLPISFNESCRILLHEGWGVYYHIDYVLFAEGTTVEPFPREFSSVQYKAIRALSDRFLCDCGYMASGSPFDRVSVPAGGSVEIYNTAGVGSISEICIKIDRFEELTAEERETIASAVTLSAFWDGCPEPAVWAPIGGLCGTPLGDVFHSYNIGLTGDGVFYCRYLMPFENGARIILENEFQYDISVGKSVSVSPLRFPIGDYCRFHAKWSRNRHPVIRPDRWPDHTLLSTTGRGRYLGVSFHAYEMEDYGWWGEGDEKIFVDGEHFPSWIGTGSEDYFGFSFGKANMFERPYHAQLRQDGGFYGAGHKIDLRLHHTDSIPFQTGIEVCIEKYLEEEKVTYESVAYWYLSVDGTDDYSPVPYGKRVSPYRDYRYVPIESLLIRHNTLTLRVNEDFRLICTVLPTDNTDRRSVRWTSSEPSVVEVDDRGLLIALKPGSSRIIAAIGLEKCSCLVTVTSDGSNTAAVAAGIGEKAERFRQEVKMHTVAAYDFRDPTDPGRDVTGNGYDLALYTKLDGAYRRCSEAFRSVNAPADRKAILFDGASFLVSRDISRSPMFGLTDFTITYLLRTPTPSADSARESGRPFKIIADKGCFATDGGWLCGIDYDMLLAGNHFFSIRVNGELAHNCVNSANFQELSWQRITITVEKSGRVRSWFNSSLCREFCSDGIETDNADHPLTLGAAVRLTENGYEIDSRTGYCGEMADFRILNFVPPDDMIGLL